MTEMDAWVAEFRLRSSQKSRVLGSYDNNEQVSNVVSYVSLALHSAEDRLKKFTS